MKKLLFVVLAASSCYASGPNYGPNYTPQNTDKEFHQVYQDLQYPKISTGTAQNFTIVNSSITNIHFTDGTNQTTAASSGVGRIIQIKTLQTTAGTAGTSSTFFAISAVTNSITMSKAANKIRISLSGDLFCQNVATTNAFLTIKRDSTNLGDATAGLGYIGTNLTSAAFKLGANVGIVIYDSPGDTSAHTYQAFVRNSDNATNCQFPGLTQASLTLEEIIQ